MMRSWNRRTLGMLAALPLAFAGVACEAADEPIDPGIEAPENGEEDGGAY
jgi:hypothetical protein